MLYIDKLKALAMLLVVWGHTMYFCMYHGQADIGDPVLSIICTFHVPLFFFLSGVVIAAPPDFRKFIAKARRFLVPMLVVGVVNAVLIDRVDDFFLDSGHNGYWYLLTLTQFYLLLVPFRYCKSLFSVPLALLVWFVAYFSVRIQNPVLSALNIGGVFAYWPYFIIGYFCRKYSVLDLVTGRPWLIAVFILAYVTLLIALFPYINQLPLVIEYILALLAIAGLVALFSHFGNSHTFFDRQQLLIGNSTLDIYVYHYFIIRLINLEFLKTQSLPVEMAVTATLAVIIVYCSLFAGRFVKLLISKSGFHDR